MTRHREPYGYPILYNDIAYDRLRNAMTIQSARTPSMMSGEFSLRQVCLFILFFTLYRIKIEVCTREFKSRMLLGGLVGNVIACQPEISELELK